MLCSLPLLYTSGHTIRGLCGHLAGCHRYLLGETWGFPLASLPQYHHYLSIQSNINLLLCTFFGIGKPYAEALVLLNAIYKKGETNKKRFLLQKCKSLVYQTAWHFCVWGTAHLSTLFSCLHGELALTVCCPNKISFISLNRSWSLTWNGRGDESWPH